MYRWQADGWARTLDLLSNAAHDALTVAPVNNDQFYHIAVFYFHGNRFHSLQKNYELK